MYKSDNCSSGAHPVYSTGTNLMYKSDSGVLRCPLLKWFTLESAARHIRSYLTYRFVRQLRSTLILVQVSNASRRVTLARLIKAALVFLESYTSVYCTAPNPCAQRSCILLTPICTIHFIIYYASIWTSGRQRVDCIKPCDSLRSIFT